MLWIDSFEIEFVSPSNWSSVVDPSLCIPGCLLDPDALGCIARTD